MVFNDFSRSNTNLAVAQLTDDYLGVAAIGDYFGMPSYGVEGGGIFSRNGTWYVMSGTGCCFCPTGGSVLVWTAPAPLGPYTYQGSVNAWDNATSVRFPDRLTIRSELIRSCRPIRSPRSSLECSVSRL